MIANAFFATTVVFLGILFFLLGECRFLVPYRPLLIEKYGVNMALFAAVVFLNVFAGFYAVGRKLFLKDTGRKLAHIEKQLRTGDSISDELTARLTE